MATQEQIDELMTAINKLRGQGTYHGLFMRFAGPDKLLDRDELKELLKAAGVGNSFTRGAWRDGVMKAVDGPGNGDDKISWEELCTLIGQDNCGPSASLSAKLDRMFA